MKIINRWIYNLSNYFIQNKLSESQCSTIFDTRYQKDQKIALKWGIVDIIDTCKNNHDGFELEPNH